MRDDKESLRYNTKVKEEERYDNEVKEGNR